jgi:hypothetical protein
MNLLSTNAGVAERFLYFVVAIVWWFALPCAAVAFLGAAALAISFQIPPKARWGGCAAVGGAWAAIGFTYLLFNKM